MITNQKEIHSENSSEFNSNRSNEAVFASCQNNDFLYQNKNEFAHVFQWPDLARLTENETYLGAQATTTPSDPPELLTEAPNHCRDLSSTVAPEESLLFPGNTQNAGRVKYIEVLVFCSYSFVDLNCRSTPRLPLIWAPTKFVTIMSC